jgi:voltage-gated potassium channel
METRRTDPAIKPAVALRSDSEERLTRALEWPMALLALVMIPVLLVDDGATTPRAHAIALTLNWIVWLGFCGEFVVRAYVSTDRGTFVRRAWFDLLIIIVSPPIGVPESMQGVRVLRALRLLRVFRAAAILTIGLRAAKRVLAHRQFHYVFVVALGVIVVGALGLFVVERHQNDGVRTFGDALWWAVTTATTVGYGDVYPKTGEGRMIAVVLMLTGIGLVGVFTATIASAFTHSRDDEIAKLHKKMERLETKLDQVLARTQEL